MIAVEDSEGGVNATVYDADGRVVENANPLATANSYSHRVGYEYDAMGRVIKKTLEDGVFILYSYDLNGNITSQTDEQGNITTYTYDSNNRLLTETDPMAGVKVTAQPRGKDH